MNVKLPVLTVGVLFFCGQALMGQKTKTVDKPITDTASTKNIEEVVLQGYRTVTKKTAAVSSATVSNETIENRPNANVLNTLQGQLAGVNIIAGSGQPGAKPEVIIRGVGTINGNFDPLYVIDGFPSNSDSFRTLNPNDIESITVQKDAAALAEYGSRASNGVIEIRTKRAGFNMPLSIRYSNQFGVSVLQDAKYRMANSQELLTIQRANNSGMGVGMTDEQIANYSINTDWTKYFFRPAITTSHNINIENGGKNLSSFTSLGYFDQEGILKTTALKRFTLRNNLSGKSDNGRLKYNVSSAVGYSKNNLATNLGTGAVNRNYVLGAYASSPLISPEMYQNSEQFFQLYQNNGTLLYTPLMLIDQLKKYYNLTEEARFDLVTDLSYKISKDFTARVKTSGQLQTVKSVGGESPTQFNAYLFADQVGYKGIETTSQTQTFLFNNLWQLNYRKSFGDHTFDISGNAEYNHSRYNLMYIRQNGLNPVTYIPGTGAGYIDDTPANDFNVPRIQINNLRLDMISYFGSFDYDFAKRFGVVASFRRDGSNRFKSGYQWGNFWSVGGRWNLEEESFIQNIDFINMLKFRGSYGTTGNQRYLYQSGLGRYFTTTSIFAGLVPPGFADSYTILPAANAYNGGQSYNINFGYPPLTWETTTAYNVGLDFELFSKKLRGNFDRYERKTTDLFYEDPTSPILGTTFINKNTDITVRNEGYELNLAYDAVRNQDWLFTIRANGSLNNQRVFDMKEPRDLGTMKLENGHLMYEFFVYKYLGVNPANGNMLFEDINGNPTERPTLADRRFTGKNFYPKYQGGFGFDLNYKGWFMSTTFTFVAGISRFDWDMAGYYNPLSAAQFRVSSDLVNAWTPTNTITDVPALKAGNYPEADYSDRFLVDASYVRLRNFQIGYKVPANLLANTFVKDLSITLQGENLVTFSKWQGYDPESNRNADQYQYPTPRIVTLGFDVKF